MNMTWSNKLNSSEDYEQYYVKVQRVNKYRFYKHLRSRKLKDLSIELLQFCYH